jgi:hypothetical protein
MRRSGKTLASWGSVEATNRAPDVKVRLAPKIGLERFGTRPLAVGRLLVFPDEWTHRRVAERHAQTLDTVYPARGREIRSWVRRPSGAMSGLWFLSKRQVAALDDEPDSVKTVGRPKR